MDTRTCAVGSVQMEFNTFVYLFTRGQAKMTSGSGLKYHLTTILNLSPGAYCIMFVNLLITYFCVGDNTIVFTPKPLQIF